jgi:hypothetical protein
MSETEIKNNQTGDNNRMYLIAHADTVNIYIKGNIINVKNCFANISSALLSYRSSFVDNVRIDRNITKTLYDFCCQDIIDDKSRIAVLMGSAGMGKSVVMHDLLELLNANDKVGVLGIKADRVVNNEGIASDMIGKDTPLIDLIRKYATTVDRFVLLVDQIDALSQSMSNDRRAINYQNNLIKAVKLIPNAKIVISCRPYDMQYDPILDEYSRYTTFELTKLTENEVQKVLHDAGIKHDQLGKNLILFLSTPLHLYIYCKLCKLNNKASFGEDVTLQKMYDKVWSEYIIREPEKHNLDSDKIVSLMGKLSDEMFDEQSLFVNFKKYEDNYNTEISCLSSNGILTIEDDTMQFFHQSFFDYVYARMFIHSHKSLTAELNKAHQGLFIRQRVKQILTYEREVDKEAYAKHLEEIFYSGHSYRYHIKMLVLTTIGSFSNVLPCEKHFIEEHILKDKNLAKVFIESIYSQAWFDIFIHTEYASSAIANKDIERIKLIIEMCARLVYSEPYIVLKYINNDLCTIDDENVKFNIGNILNRSSLSEYVPLTESIYRKVCDKSRNLTMATYLNSIAGIDADFVKQELIRNLDIHLKALGDNKILSNLRLDYEVKEVYESISKTNRDVWFDLLFEVILKLLEYNKSNISGHHNRLRYSSCYIMFARNEAHLDYYHYNMADRMFDLVEKYAVEDTKWLNPRLKQMTDTGFAMFLHFVMAAYAKNPQYYKNAIYKILTDKELLEDFYPSSATYTATVMLKSSFNVFNDEEKRRILDTIMSLQPEAEKIALVVPHKYGHSLTDIGITTGYYLHALGDDVLKDYLNEQREYHKLLEKYKSLDCTPSRMQSQVGWIAIPEEKRKKMSDEDIMKSLVSYNEFPAIGEPDAMGTNIAFGQDAQKNPERFAKIIDRLLNDSQYSIDSITEGIKGLMSAKYDNEVIKKFVNRTIARLEDLNKAHGSDIMKLLQLTDYFVKSDNLPPFIINFICDVLTKHDDDSFELQNAGHDLYTTGINRVNGNAGYKLVNCYKHKEYKELIFSTLESVASTASPVTRSAILLEMRQLMWLDEDRTRTLYLMLLHDYNEDLIAMPLHNYNPILGFTGKHFPMLHDLIEEALKKPRCYRVIVVFLWLAYYCGNHEAYDYILKITDKSTEAQVVLLQQLLREDRNLTKKFADQFFYRFLNSNDKDVGAQYDAVFHYLDKWDKNDMISFVSAYCKSCVSTFASKGVLDFLEKAAAKNPHHVLDWISLIYENKKQHNDTNSFVFSKILNIITIAYNGIHKYDKNDKTLEKAMDIFDEILQNDDIRRSTRYYLDQLDSSEN